MNDQSNMNQNQSEPSDPMSRHEARMQRRAERLADPSQAGTWVVGIILIILGGMFLLRNTGIFDITLKNWWAFFILIPALGSLDSARRMYQSAGNQLTGPARGSLLVGAVLTFVTAMFIFDLDWSFFGPVLIILAGIGIPFTYTRNNQE